MAPAGTTPVRRSEAAAGLPNASAAGSVAPPGNASTFTVGAANGHLLDPEVNVICAWTKTNFGSADASSGARLELDRALQKTANFFRHGGTLYDAIRYNDGETSRVPIVDVLRKTYFPNLDLVPGGIMLSEFETETPTALSRGEQPVFFNRIRDSLRQVEDDYDIVLIDCPPQLGYLTMAAVCASTSLLMTIIPERVDLASASQFLTMASGVLEVLYSNGGIGAYDNFAYLLTRFDTAISTQQDLSEWLRQLLGDSVIKTPFVKSSAVSEAGLSQKTIFEVDLATTKNRKTYERALESVMSFSNDIEKMIQSAWGRGGTNEA